MDAALQMLLDRAAITDVILRFARSFDLHDWPMMRASLCDTLEIDYRDFRGEPVRTVTGDEYVTNRRSTLAHLKMQHLVTGHLITITGDEAECLSNFVIYRFSPEMETENTYDTHGAYTFRLYRAEQGWRIGKIRQSVYWSSGNPLIHGAHRK